MIDESTAGGSDATEALIEPAAPGTNNSDVPDNNAKKALGGRHDPRGKRGKFGSQAAERARTFAGEGKDRATDALAEVARLMENAAGDVDEKLGPEYGKYARSAAQGISGFAETLRGKQVDTLIGRRDFVRKSPVIAVGTAAAIGFVIARLIKSGVDAAADLGDRDAPSSDTKA